MKTVVEYLIALLLATNIAIFIYAATKHVKSEIKSDNTECDTDCCGVGENIVDCSEFARDAEDWRKLAKDWKELAEQCVDSKIKKK